MLDDNFVSGFAVGAVSVGLLFILLGIGFTVIRPWVRMILMGGRGKLFSVIGMRLRGTMLIIEAYTSLLHAGEDVTLAEVERQFIVYRSKVRSSHDLIELFKIRRFEG